MMDPPANPATPPFNHPARSSARSCMTVGTVFAALAVAAVFLLLLPTALIGPVFVGGALLLICVISMHYLVWGRWLSRILAEESSREQDTNPPPDGV